MLLGICGGEGAGKTTIANILSSPKLNYVKTSIIPKKYVINELIFCKEEEILNLMKKFIDTRWDWSWCKTNIEIFEKIESNWKQISFADSLKKVCSILFNYSYITLLGEQNRNKRETLKTKKYNICGSLTGRQILEYFGTTVIRNNFDDLLWIKIVSKQCKLKHYNWIITDVRFKNEKEMLFQLNGKLLLVYKNYDEFRTIDRKLHPAKWFYKTFLSDINYFIDNSKDISFLKEQLKLFI